MSDIRQWLNSLGLNQYAEAFEQNAIAQDVLGELTDEDLRTLGVDALGDRKRILRAICALEAEKDPGPDPSSDAGTLPEPLPTAERRQITVMFCDLVGSVELGERMDVEDYRDLLARFRNTIVDAVQRNQGFVARHHGDGLLAYFGFPQAHEDDAERAVRAGLEVISAVSALDHPYEAEPQVRVGIATGQSVVGDVLSTGASQRAELAALGPTPNLAARLQGEAEPNTVVISETTHALSGRHFDVQALPPRALKGMSGKVSLYRVRVEVSGQSRFDARSGPHLTPFVGRKEELELLTRRWARTQAGQGQVVLIMGEAGIGKSRLLRQLRTHIRGEPHEIISLQCSPYHESSALHPVSSAFHRALGLAEKADVPTRLAALEQHLAAMGETNDRTLGLLAHLLSISAEDRFPTVEIMDAAQRREQTLRTLVDYTVKRADALPLLCAVEDVHWLDPTTREFLGRLVETVASKPMLIVATSRPGVEARWTDLAHVHVLSLSRLGPKEGKQLADAIASTATRLPEDILQTILSRAEGNPLFIEELTRTLSHSEPYNPSSRAIPTTLQDSLMARLDASQAGKTVAQCAAVIGREFEHKLLAELWEGAPGQLNEGLDALDQSGLISRRGEGELMQYVFKHALVQDAAYESLLRERRTHLHARAATALESLMPEVSVSQPELLARHYTDAGLIEEAVVRWLAAADRANTRSASEECIAHSAAGLALLDDFPAGQRRDELEADLHLAWARAERALRRFAANEMGVAYLRAREVSERLGDPWRLTAALEGRARFCIMRGQYLELQEIIHCMEATAKSADEPAMFATAYELAGIADLMIGKTGQARANYERALEAFQNADADELRAIRGHSLDVYTLRGLAYAYSSLGFLDRALETAEMCLKRAEDVNNPFFICESLWGMLSVCFKAHEYERLRSAASRLIEIAESEHWRFQEAFGKVYLGIALGGLGQFTEAISQIEWARAQFESLGDTIGLHQVRQSPIAVFLALAGRQEEAISLARGVASTSGGHALERPITLLRLGEVLRLVGSTPEEKSEADASLRKSIALAQEMDLKTYELEATLGLVKLLQATTERGAVREMLTGIYESFAEGHETKLLLEAKNLLQELC